MDLSGKHNIQNIALCDKNKIILPPLHMKLMEQFMSVLNNECTTYLGISERTFS